MSKTDATVRKACATAQPTRFCHPRAAQLVFVLMVCTKLVVKRCLHARSLDCAAALQWLAARSEPANVLIHRVQSFPMHTHTHSGLSRHINRSGCHLPPNEVTRKTAKRDELSHGLCHRGMLGQSHVSRRDCCSHASSTTVGLRDLRVCALR